MTVGGLSSELFSTLQQAATHRCLIRCEALLVRITFDPKMRDTRSGLRQGDRAFVFTQNVSKKERNRRLGQLLIAAQQELRT